MGSFSNMHELLRVLVFCSLLFVVHVESYCQPGTKLGTFSPVQGPSIKQDGDILLIGVESSRTLTLNCTITNNSSKHHSSDLYVRIGSNFGFNPQETRPSEHTLLVDLNITSDMVSGTQIGVFCRVRNETIRHFQEECIGFLYLSIGEEPRDPPDNVKCVVHNDTVKDLNMVCSWIPLLGVHDNLIMMWKKDIDDRFNHCVHLDGNSCRWPKPEDIDHRGTANINDAFAPDHIYNIKFYVNNTHGEKYSNVISVHTSELIKPDMVNTSYVIGAHYIYLKWQQPRNSHVKDGYIYKISYNGTTHWGDFTPTNETVVENQSSINLTSLKPYTDYTLSIAAKTKIEGSRYFSDPRVITVRTQQAAPSAAPRMSPAGYTVTLCGQDCRNVVLYFKPVEDSQLNGKLSHYSIHLRPRHSRVLYPLYQETTQTLENLSLEDKYVVTLRAYTGDKVDYASPEANLTIPAQSTMPPKLKKVAAVKILDANNSTHISMTWTPVSNTVVVFWCKGTNEICEQLDPNDNSDGPRWKKVDGSLGNFVVPFPPEVKQVDRERFYIYAMANLVDGVSSGLTWSECLFNDKAVPVTFPVFKKTDPKTQPDNGAALSWEQLTCDQSGGAIIDTYQLAYIKLENGENDQCESVNENTWEIITKIDVSTTSYTVTDLDSEATYCFRIRAVARHNLFSTWGPKEGLQLGITGLTTAEIAGIVIAAVIASIMVLIGVYCVFRHCRREVQSITHPRNVIEIPPSVPFVNGADYRPNSPAEETRFFPDHNTEREENSDNRRAEMNGINDYNGYGKQTSVDSGISFTSEGEDLNGTSRPETLNLETVPEEESYQSEKSSDGKFSPHLGNVETQYENTPMNNNNNNVEVTSSCSEQPLHSQDEDITSGNSLDDSKVPNTQNGTSVNDTTIGESEAEGGTVPYPKATINPSIPNELVCGDSTSASISSYSKATTSPHGSLEDMDTTSSSNIAYARWQVNRDDSDAVSSISPYSRAGFKDESEQEQLNASSYNEGDSSSFNPDHTSSTPYSKFAQNKTARSKIHASNMSKSTGNLTSPYEAQAAARPLHLFEKSKSADRISNSQAMLGSHSPKEITSSLSSVGSYVKSADQLSSLSSLGSYIKGQEEPNSADDFSGSSVLSSASESTPLVRKDKEKEDSQRCAPTMETSQSELSKRGSSERDYPPMISSSSGSAHLDLPPSNATPKDTTPHNDPQHNSDIPGSHRLVNDQIGDDVNGHSEAHPLAGVDGNNYVISESLITPVSGHAQQNGYVQVPNDLRPRQNGYVTDTTNDIGASPFHQNGYVTSDSTILATRPAHQNGFVTYKKGHVTVDSLSKMPIKQNGYVTSDTTSAPKLNGYVTSDSTSAPDLKGYVTSDTTSAPELNGYVTSGTLATPGENGYISSESMALLAKVPIKQNGYVTSDTTSAPELNGYVTSDTLATPDKNGYITSETMTALAKMPIKQNGYVTSGTTSAPELNGYVASDTLATPEENGYITSESMALLAIMPIKQNGYVTSDTTSAPELNGHVTSDTLATPEENGYITSETMTSLAKMPTKQNGCVTSDTTSAPELNGYVTSDTLATPEETGYITSETMTALAKLPVKQNGYVTSDTTSAPELNRYVTSDTLATPEENGYITSETMTALAKMPVKQNGHVTSDTTSAPELNGYVTSDTLATPEEDNSVTSETMASSVQKPVQQNRDVTSDTTSASGVNEEMTSNAVPALEQNGYVTAESVTALVQNQECVLDEMAVVIEETAQTNKINDTTSSESSDTTTIATDKTEADIQVEQFCLDGEEPTWI